MSEFDLLIVGGGVVGLSTAIAARKADVKKVAIVDPLAAANAIWASGDESRLFRLSYFENVGYVPLLRRAIDEWNDLAPDILIQCGNLYAGSLESTLVAGSLEAAREHGLDHQMLSATDVAMRFAQFSLGVNEVAYFEAKGGYIRAAKATQALASKAKTLGVEWIHEEVKSVESVGHAWRVNAHGTQQVVVAAGHHTSNLVACMKPLLTAREHFVYWLESLVSPSAGPGFGFMNEAGEMLYGFPSQGEGLGIKVGGHCDVAAGTSGEQFAAISRLVSRYLPGASETVLRSRSCVYDNSPD